MASADPTRARHQARSKRQEPADYGDMDDDQEEQARERDQVEAYVGEHALERTLTDLLNDVVADRPADPLLALSSLLLARSTASARGILHVQLVPLLVPAHQRSSSTSTLVRIHTAKGVFTATCSAGSGDGVWLDGKRAEGSKTKPIDYVALNEAVNEALGGLDPTDQHVIDEALERLAVPERPANNSEEITETTLPRHVSLACSLAVCQAGAKFAERPLRHHVAVLAGHDITNASDASSCVPMPLFSVINGGAIAANKLFAQEVFVAPVSAVSFSDALAIGTAFHHALRAQLDARGAGFSNVGAFGGFAPQLQSLAEVFQLLRAALDDTRAELASQVSRGEGEDGVISIASETDGDPSRASPASVSPLEITFGVDFAASEFVLGPVVLPVKQTDSPAEGTTEATDEGSEPPVEGTGDDPDTRAASLPPGPPAFTYDTDKWVPGSSGTFKASGELLEIVNSSILELSLASVVDPFAASDVGHMAALVSTIEQDTTSSSLGISDADVPPPVSSQVVARSPLLPQYASDTSASVASRIEALASARACDAVALELRQFTTLSQLLEAITTAQRFGLGVVFGASAGDAAEDGEMLAAIALGAGNVKQVKFGGLLSAESVDRYNRVLLASLEPDAPPFAGRETKA